MTTIISVTEGVGKWINKHSVKKNSSNEYFMPIFTEIEK